MSGTCPSSCKMGTRAKETKKAAHEHIVQLYDGDDSNLVRNVGYYLWDGLKRGEGVLTVATPAHTEAFIAEMRALGADTDAAVREGRLVAIDAHETLGRFMVNGEPNWRRFEATVGGAIEQFQGRSDLTGLSAYGEMVGLLWQDGATVAAIQLEQFWNRLLTANAFKLFCAYQIDVFGKDFHMAAVDELLCAHTHLVPAGTEGELDKAIDRAITDVLGSRAAGLRPLIKANFRPSWAAVPRAEAVILWLRNNLPDSSDEILNRARQYYQTSELVA